MKYRYIMSRKIGLIYTFIHLMDSKKQDRQTEIQYIQYNSIQLASCLIYARTFVEYICGCVLFQDVTVREIRGR